MKETVSATRAKLGGAHLHRRGYPREHSPDGREPRIYDYAIMDHSQPFKIMTGDYTRFGRVTELLTKTDDKFVIFGRGEEVTLEFPVKGLPRVPQGSVRTLPAGGAGVAPEFFLCRLRTTFWAPSSWGRTPRFFPGGAPPQIERGPSRLKKSGVLPLQNCPQGGTQMPF